MKHHAFHASAAIAALLACLAAAPAGAETGDKAGSSTAQSDHKAGASTKAASVHVVSARFARLSRGTISLSPRRLSPSSASDLETLRQELTQKLEALNAPSPAEMQPLQAGASQAASAATVPPRPVCRPLFDMTSWQGGDFIERRAQLRARIADSHAAGASLAALAEFFLAHGLAAEALDAAGEGIADGGPIPPRPGRG